LAVDNEPRKEDVNDGGCVILFTTMGTSMSGADGAMIDKTGSASDTANAAANHTWRSAAGHLRASRTPAKVNAMVTVTLAIIDAPSVTSPTIGVMTVFFPSAPDRFQF
jgi:hypothetical protein